MAMQRTHRIRRLRWQARAAGSAEALALRTLLHGQQEACEQAFDNAFDAAARPDELWHLPKLELRLRIDGALQAADLAARAEAAVREALAQLARTPMTREEAAMMGAADAQPAQPGQGDVQAMPVSRLSVAQSAQEALRHYLARGLLPWTLAGLAPEAAQRDLAEAAVAAATAVTRHQRDPAALLPAGADLGTRIGALLRWLALLGAPVRRQLLRTHRPPLALPAATMAAWLAWIDDDDAGPQRLTWQALWLAAAADPAPLRAFVEPVHAGPDAPPFLQALRDALAVPGLTKPSPSNAATSTAARPASAGAIPQDAAPEALLVPLAGLVLLHPWLPRLLDACGVLQDKQPAPQHLPRACALLHALACSDAPIAEHQLPMAKLLLGQPPDAPLGAALPAITPADHAEIDALLDAVRTHWRALRGTASDGLRLSFLQRRGLLASGEAGWQLRLQSEPFDMLLGTLPWPIALVRLPWMPRPLNVEWPTP